MINLSIVQGHFPDEMKLAKLLPIYKSENEQFVQNYGFISVLPYFSKIYKKKDIYNHTIDYIDENETLYDKQFGFRKGHSTSHAIVTLAEKVVLQGSILGTFFFILFMNDFSRASEIFFTILFVDDTSVFLVGTEYAKLIELINVEFERVSC